MTMAYRISSDLKNALIVTDASADESGELSKFLIDGKWSLSGDHELKLKVSGNQSPYSGKTVIFTGDIEKATGSSLVFRARTSDALSGMRASSIELRGTWQADRNNRLVFRAAKSKGRDDILKLEGAWEISKNNELIYRYERTVLKRSTKQLKTLIFQGFWDIDKDRLIYRLEGNDDSFFSFRASLGSKSLRASEGKIKYQIGAGYSQKNVYREFVKTVTIFGKWKLSNEFGADFEVAYSGRKRRSIKFGIEKAVGKNSALAVSLKSATGESLGMDVSFSRKITEDVELFVDLSHSRTESRVMGGVRARF